MNQKIEYKREDMTYEEFIILCAKLSKEERRNIVNPIDSLEAKTQLTESIDKKMNFLQFCINNFLEMHHHISRLYLLEKIYNALLFPSNVSFDLYDILIQKFFIEYQPDISDVNIKIIFRIQAKLFFLLYDQEFWMQLFVCQDCDMYLLKRPEYLVIGFINCLIDSIDMNKSMSIYIKKMIDDGVIEILIKYLFDKTVSGINESMKAMFRIIELLDPSVISETPVFEFFLNSLQENPSNSFEFFSAVFSNGNTNKIIANERKVEIIDFIEQKNLFNYFNDYIVNQASQETANDDNSISQFSNLLYMIFYPLFPSQFKEEDRDENEFLIPIFKSFCPIFFQTLICLKSISGDYSNLLKNLSILLPDERSNLLDILFEKLNVLLTNSQNFFNDRTYIINYLDLYTDIQNNDNKSEDAYIQLFQRLETGIENLDRTKLFLSILNQVIDYDEYNKSNYNDIYDDELDNDDEYEYENSNCKNVVKNNYYYSESKIQLLNSTVQYYDFILNEDFPISSSGEDLYIELVTLYSQIVFKWADTCQKYQWGIYISRIFSIVILHMYNFPSIIDLCLKKDPEDIQKIEGADSIALNLLSSMNKNLILIGLKLLKLLSLEPQKRDDILIEAIQSVIQTSTSQIIEFDSISPLFMSTSVESINERRKTENGSNCIDTEVVTSIHDFMIQLKNDTNDWITSFLHFFGFIFFDDVRDLYDPIFQVVESEKESEIDPDVDFDFEKVTIITRQLKKFVTSSSEDFLEFVTTIILHGTKKSERLIKEFTLDSSESIFSENRYHMYSLPQTFIEAVDFTNQAASFLVSFFNHTKNFEIYLSVLPFLKMCCEWPIIKREETLFAIFHFVVENDQDSINEFLHCSFHLIRIIKNNKSFFDNLFAVAHFHKMLVISDKDLFLSKAESEIEIPGKYLKILCDESIQSDSDFKKRVKKVFS